MKSNVKDFKTIEIHQEKNTLILRLNRPEVHNAVNEQMMAELAHCLDSIETDATLRAIILTGAGQQTFCAGGDLKYFSTLQTRRSCLAMSRRMQRILTRFSSLRVPVIAAINGQALGGGCEILTACHFRIAASHAQFSFRQAPNGIITGWGGGRRLFEILGKSKALQLFLTGEQIDARTALQFGLIDRIVDSEHLLEDAIALAKKIQQNSADAVAAFLELSECRGRMSPSQFIAFETEKFAELWTQEAFQTFLKRYRPESSPKK